MGADELAMVAGEAVAAGGADLAVVVDARKIGEAKLGGNKLAGGAGCTTL
jgi:hypothetical protein